MVETFEQYHTRLLCKDNLRIKDFLESMRNSVIKENLEEVTIQIDLLKEKCMKDTLSNRKYCENCGETMLHVAAKFNRSSKIIKALIKEWPELMKITREGEYQGQTALHIAIIKGNVDVVKAMLKKKLPIQSQIKKTTLLHQMATGVKFANTVMMGELPLSVAALTFNLEMVNKLLENGAEMDRRNTKGDTVFHTLIRFAAIYPERLCDVLDILKRFHNKIHEKMSNPEGEILATECDHNDFSYIWFMPNKEDQNPLQLAAQLAQFKIFEFIIDHVYSRLNDHDGVFDMRQYDITEIDTIATEIWASHQRSTKDEFHHYQAPIKAHGVAQEKLSNPTKLPSVLQALHKEKTVSILEMMFDIQENVANEFIKHHVVANIIEEKWLYYRLFYYGWMIFHLLFMTTLTVFAIYNADKYKPQTTNTTDVDTRDKRQDQFLSVFSVIYLMIGILYLLYEAIHTVFRVKKFTVVQFFNTLHNGSYRIVLFIFSVSLILDFILVDSVPGYESIALIIALVTGWWFMVFFLRAHQKFSFFTVMIQKILIGDMLRFAVLIALFLISFTAGMYIAFQGASNQGEDYTTYTTTMLLLFKLMLGLGDIEDLYEARRPWLAIGLFIIFVIFTYVLMFNALIAMMSQTCMLVSENRLVQWRVQQLSVIIFFEEVLPSRMAKLVGTERLVERFDSEIKQEVKEKRYYLDLRNLHVDHADAKDKHAAKSNLQTMPFDGQQSGFTYFNKTMPANYQYSSFGPSSQSKKVDDKNADNNIPKEIQNNKKKSKKSRPKHTDVLLEDNVEGQTPHKCNGRKNRIEPGDDVNTIYDDQSPEVEVRGYHSENELNDTHISRINIQQNPNLPKMRLEHVSQLVKPHQNQNDKLDIVEIAD